MTHPVSSSAQRALALDLGSSAVRAIVGTLQDGQLSLQEVHRFPHTAESVSGHLTWNLDRIMTGIRDSLLAAASTADGTLASIGIDTWGVDYGLLDADGQLLRPPRAYRDKRMVRHAPALDARISRANAWMSTGITPLPINTAYQVFADLAEEPDLVNNVSSLIPLPDLILYMLGGTRGVGRAIASTTQLATPGAGAWSSVMLEATGTPASWLDTITPDGNVAGTEPLTGATLVRPGGHDTACAVHALGLAPSDVRIFISCGSWSLVGATTPEPIVTPEVLAAGLTNEVRTDGGIRLLRNLTGLWLLQECQRAWHETDVASLIPAAAKAPSLGVIVDPDDTTFQEPGDMPTKISRWCADRYGVAPRSRAQTVRLILESLACAHATYIEQLRRILGDRLDAAAPLHFIGGGARNRLLARFTASAAGAPVRIGPAEASATGNLMAQFEALGTLCSSDRAHVAQSLGEDDLIQPGDPAPFSAMLARLTEVTTKHHH